MMDGYKVCSVFERSDRPKQRDRIMEKNKVYTSGSDEKHKTHDRWRELFRYAVFGAATTVVNIAVYQLLLLFLDYRISNLIAILASKLFAFVTNKRFVFRSRCHSLRELLGEILRFILARGATGLLDYFGLILAVEVFRLDRVWSKYGLQALVIVLNYVLGKKAVFISTETDAALPAESDDERTED